MIITNSEFLNKAFSSSLFSLPVIFHIISKMLTYDLIANVYPAAFAASHGIAYRHNEGAIHSHRSRLNSTKKQQNRSGGNHQQPSNKGTSQQQQFYLDSSDTPNYCLEDSFVQRENPIDDPGNNNNIDLVDLNQLKIVTDNSVAVPISAFPSSLIQWPVDGSTKTKRIAEVKKQVKLLGNLIKMTVGGNQQDEALSDDKTPTNPPPFSAQVDMSRIPVQSLAHTADESSQPKWEDIKTHLQASRMKEAKSMVRESEWGLSSPVREELWKQLCLYHSTEKDFGDFYYWDTVKQMYGTTELSECQVQLPTCIDTNFLISQSLSPRGVSACERVLSVVAFSNPAITYAPSLYALCALLLHYMDEADAYNCMCALVGGSQNKFITQTKVSFEATWRAAITLCRKHIRGFSTLAKFGVTQEQIDEAFQGWIWWILAALPLTHVVRVIDCFLLEGAKVLLRVAMAIFQMFVKAVTRDSTMAASLPTRGLKDAIMRYCQSIQVPPQKLLKTAFGIRGFRRTEINRVILQTEMYLKSQRCMVTSGSSCNITEAPGLTRAMSLEGLPTSEAQADIKMMSHTLTIKELLTLWSWLPTRMTLHQPTLIYTTEEHGCSLTTFFQRVEKHEPTLMCIRTTNDHVFGAYCSTAWAQRNITDEYGNRQTYFGTGESFLFSLRPTVAKYQWVGITQQQEEAGISNLKHSAELFMHGDSNMITIGGGNGNGIMLDQELRFGKTENCETFNNPPLTPDADFEVKVIEVYSLTREM
ncbi:GTPase-activating protein skywalker-like isoform X4 [Macrobrachium nipponense]|uniref:GTPase-activating protein skywalker-like isoform X4 n=1 Tax=Macrobrachium nipponense TaxID=159736 RepID=UPI0030C8400E